MEDSNLPIRTWYLAMAFMTFSKKGISAAEMQRQLSHKRYEPIWYMMHKIRSAMGQRDERYQLHDMIEFDDGYFTVEQEDKSKNKPKRGRGSKSKMNVSVMAESIPLEDLNTGNQSRYCGHFKMKAQNDHFAKSINDTVFASANKYSVMFTDMSTSYVDIADFVHAHICEKSTKETTISLLPWVHIAISNAKRTLLGVYHKIKGKYLQLYLDEFVYKLNRRNLGDQLFERVVVAAVSANWYKNG